MAPKMNFRETGRSLRRVAAATFNDDDADALVEMMQLMGTNYSAANARNAMCAEDDERCLFVARCNGRSLNDKRDICGRMKNKKDLSEKKPGKAFQS